MFVDNNVMYSSPFSFRHKTYKTPHPRTFYLVRMEVMGQTLIFVTESFPSCRLWLLSWGGSSSEVDLMGLLMMFVSVLCFSFLPMRSLAITARWERWAGPEIKCQNSDE